MVNSSKIPLNLRESKGVNKHLTIKGFFEAHRDLTQEYQDKLRYED